MTSRIRRRDFLAGVGAGLLLPGCSRPAFDPAALTPIEGTDFPYPAFATHGRLALRAWEYLTDEFDGKGSAVVLGDRDDLVSLGWMFANSDTPPVADLIAASSRLDFPKGYRQHKRDAFDRTVERLRANPESAEYAEGMAERGYYDDGLTTPFGKWPVQPVLRSSSPGLSVSTQVLTDLPLDEVVIAVFPTSDWTEVPAYLDFGGFNDCPTPDWQVAILRRWRDRFGVRLAGLAGATMNLRVEKPPASREAAIELAREHYDYCPDIILQGFPDIATLAAHLKVWDWWYFWWD